MKKVLLGVMVLFLLIQPKSAIMDDAQPIRYGTIYSWSSSDTFTVKITRLEDRSLDVGIGSLSNECFFNLNAYSLDGFRVDWVQAKTEVRRFTFYRGDALRRYVCHLSGRRISSVPNSQIGFRDARGRFIKNSDPRIQELFDYIEMILREWRMADEEHQHWVDRGGAIASAVLTYPFEWQE